MNRYSLPLRFTILWAVNMAIIIALELIYGLSSYLPFVQKDVEVIFCTVGGVLAGLELMLWDHIRDKNKHNDPWEK